VSLNIWTVAFNNSSEVFPPTKEERMFLCGHIILYVHVIIIHRLLDSFREIKEKFGKTRERERDSSSIIVYD